MFRINAWRLVGLTSALVLFFIGCEQLLNPEDEKSVDEAAPIEINTIITEGPADGATLLYSASPTFRWKGEVRPGYVAAYQFAFEESTVTSDDYHDWSTEMMTTLENLEAGYYVFAVRAKDDKDSVDVTPATRSFTVNEADSLAPLIRFVQSPTDSSSRAPGSSIFFEWTATDASAFGSVDGYRYRLAGTGPDTTDWSGWNLNTTTAAYSDLSIGNYVFQVEAEDNAGIASDKAEITVFVKDATILVVDNYVPHDDPFLNEIATDKLVAEILRDWSWAEWDVAVDGYPTAADLATYSSVIWYVDDGAGEFYDYHLSPDSAGYVDNPLDDYLDGGGNLWLMGSEILYASYVAVTSWGDFTVTGESIATNDTTGLPISFRTDRSYLIESTLSLTVTLDALGDTTWGITDIDTTVTHIVLVGGDTTYIDTDTDTLITGVDTTYVGIDTTTYDTTFGPVDTTWTASTFSTDLTDNGDGDLLNASLDVVGSVSYSSGSIELDTLMTDLTGVDIVVVASATGDYHRRHNYFNLFDADKFAGKYLGVADGGDAGDDAFTGLASVGVEGFTEIGIPGLATGTGWPDELVPADTLDAIYDLGGYAEGTTAGVLYEEGTFNVVFWGVNFAFVATNGNHLTLAPVDMYPVANHILKNIFSE
ncbi:MAG: hypothetical protein JSU77_02600 [Fidelibacterota bacterium]|nr:MAG: hypothetical protein JSU77_02600 [Candidatus Neomarinimicrobiota bacterium]